MSNNNICRCGRDFPKPPAGGGAAGYAVTPEGERICYQCADVLQVDAMRREDRIVAYVGESGHLETWTGGHLARRVGSADCKLTRQSWAHGKDFASLWFRDGTGQFWYGRGSRGVAIKVRKVSRPRWF